ncbi:unnamed protein product [Parnassius apollo]|uniref:(apollo) hypothetical protein n=1 Tax=Parnassius apollo TaxID=110799 RepID=A0A8S3X641_PARAO|nr:unnamed protein product [Parnassius apollo]
MPRLAIANGLKFPDIPDVLNELTSMEERLRKFCYKHGRKEQVRPEIIRRAAEYLVTCDLFRTYDIELEGSWTNNEPEDTVECTCSSPEQESNIDEIPDVNPGGTETLLDENQDLTIVSGSRRR